MQFPFASLRHTLVEVFKEGHIEVSDFLSEAELLRTLCAGKPVDAVEKLKSEFPAAAKYVAGQYGIATDIRIRDGDLKLENRNCNNNEVLHGEKQTED